MRVSDRNPWRRLLVRSKAVFALVIRLIFHTTNFPFNRGEQISKSTPRMLDENRGQISAIRQLMVDRADQLGDKRGRS